MIFFCEKKVILKHEQKFCELANMRFDNNNDKITKKENAIYCQKSTTSNPVNMCKKDIEQFFFQIGELRTKCYFIQRNTKQTNCSGYSQFNKNIWWRRDRGLK